jgi:hypothetical protein
VPGIVMPGLHRHGRGRCWTHRHSWDRPRHWHCGSRRHRNRHCHNGFCHWH